MNIGEIIEALEGLAQQLPDGRSSEVRVHVCNGHDAPGVLTASIEVDVMQQLNGSTGEIAAAFAIVQGHPHKDPGRGVETPIMMDVDDVVAQWSADFAERGRSRPRVELEYTTDPTTGVRYVLLPAATPGTWVRFELTEAGGIRYRPGAATALAAGCLCDPGKNNAGHGMRGDDNHAFIFRKDCPVHLQILRGDGTGHP